MLLVYISLTGNVKKFVNRVSNNNYEIGYSLPIKEVDEEYLIIVPSYDDEITDLASEFINFKRNEEYLIGFAGSGNKNWDEHYCKNAKQLAENYNKPLIFNFELSGTDKDIEKFKEEVNKFAITKTSK